MYIAATTVKGYQPLRKVRKVKMSVRTIAYYRLMQVCQVSCSLCSPFRIDYLQVVIALLFQLDYLIVVGIICIFGIKMKPWLCLNFCENGFLFVAGRVFSTIA